MKAKYVFVVGLPKTGTKLIRSILENSRHVHCRISHENFFLGSFIHHGVRGQIRKFGDLSQDANIHKIVDYMYSGKLVGTYWKHLKSGSLGVDKETFKNALLNSDRSDKGIYATLLQIHTPVDENTLLGDKTPAHLYHVPTLMGWFPDAKIIHTFRDPRAILASEWKKKMKRPANRIFKFIGPAYSPVIVLHVTLTWLHAVKLHHRYAKQYPQSYFLSKFEDLVTKPEKQVRKLCEFLDIKFDPEMLSPKVTGSSFSAGGTGFDQQALTRWQRHLKPWMKAWLLFWGKKQLSEFGYI